jgi:hypothetical protein
MAWVSLSLGSESRVWTQTQDPDSEFNSIHFGREIKKKNFFETQKFFGYQKIFLIFLTFFRPIKIFGTQNFYCFWVKF